jgi:hypothetical protein
MERELPSGRVQNELTIVAHEAPGEFGIRTASGPTRFSYRYTLSTTAPRRTGTGDAAALLGPLAGRAVKHGVDDNFAELKRILETPAALA